MLGDFSLLHVHLETLTAFGQLLHLRAGGALLLRPAGQQGLFGADSRLVQHPPVAQVDDELEGKGGQAQPADADERRQHQGQGGEAQDDDTVCEGQVQPEHRQGGEHTQNPGLHGVSGLDHAAHQGAALNEIGWDDVDIPFFLSHGFSS